MAYDFDLFVIGGGSAGVRSARIAAGHGARVGVAEERFWGGTCVNVGCVPKKIMVNAAEYGAWAEDAAAFGWSIETHGHDWAKLAAARDAEVARLSGIYGRLLGNAVVVGGGYIAVEFACILKGLGAEVTLVHRAPLPLRGFDEDIRSAAAEALVAQGITCRAGVSPTRIEAQGAARLLHLSDGSAAEFDAVFFCTGRAPATDGLGLEKAGVAVNAAGAIVVNEDHATSQPHIFAIGDVLDRVNLTPMATAVGHALADTLYGNNPRRVSYENVPTAVFMNPPIGTVGITEEEAAKRGPADIYVTRFTPMRHTISKRDGRKTLMKLVVCQKTQKILGAHMIGEDAGEMMQGIGIAVVMGATKQDFDRTIGIHPTAAEEFVTLRTRTRVVGA
ncbi:MAG: glutathione-disulfide reductase [Acetobacteraceae bacterium]|nr:glutathione-disulfide reductase [Acetobacteraceae bacterium]